MISREDFAQTQLELTAEFAKYLVEHPEVDELLLEESYIYFEVTGEPEFNAYSRQLAERREREDGKTAVCIRVKMSCRAGEIIDSQIMP